MIQLRGIGHVLLRVTDVEKAKAFYTMVLGFETVEEDPEHGGTFMALPGQSHAIDLFPVRDAEAAARQAPGVRGHGHIAFRVDSEAALKEAWLGLREHGVAITRAVDHVSQKSIYFQDPDGNALEIYYELPNARHLFREGRQDRDAPLTFAG
ncbi:MAG TPA: VOC family protein [Vicinamibacteria bacterium]|nr:VOC family protein [Vicinamibacteria bacterium]